MLSLLLEEIAERHPEAALLRGVPEIGLRLRLLLVRPRLLARQTNAPSPSSIARTRTFISLPAGNMRR